MLGLLGYLGAGGAGGYARTKNAQTEALNKVEMALISAEADDWYKQRAEERMMAAEGIKYQRGIERDDAVFERDRSAKKEDFGMASEHDLRKMETSHGYAKELEGSRQAAADRRARMSQDGAMERAKMGLLNRGSSSGSTSGDLSPKEIAKADDSDNRRIFELQKEMTDPMNARNTERSELLKQEIARLRDGIASRRYGDAPPNLNLLYDGIQLRREQMETERAGNAPLSPTGGQSMQQQAYEPSIQQPTNFDELEGALSKLPYNSPERAELQKTFDSMRPTIAKLRVIEEKLRNLPINASQNERAQLNAEREQLRREIESELA